jgi:hypothetical protein
MLASKSPRAIVLQQACISKVTLGKLTTVFTIASSGYCLIHLLLTHHFSAQVLLGAFPFGTAATITIAWITERARPSR